ncbi:MAG: type II restriction endonuclease [Actinomycetota bacterium]|nr:type II restriction endonuclease [Actinomycetota bacterium]
MIKFDLRAFADSSHIFLKHQKLITEEAVKNIVTSKNLTNNKIKNNFDSIFSNIEKEAYRLYLIYEEIYGKEVFSTFIEYLYQSKRIKSILEIKESLGEYFYSFDKFFLSLSQSRRSRSGKTFESITNSLFKSLNYPFNEQILINGKHDFLMPSEKHYRENPLDCIIFTTKRTLRERWRQIVTEGTRGLGFYLATIDEKISSTQLEEMLKHRIYVVCPQTLKDKCYNNDVNVLSFRQFFKDHLDPAMKRWKDNGVI